VQVFHHLCGPLRPAIAARLRIESRRLRHVNGYALAAKMRAAAKLTPDVRGLRKPVSPTVVSEGALATL